MVLVFGMERMSFELLRVLRENALPVHCIVNRWGSQRIVAMAEEIGASLSTGYYWYRFDRHTRNPIRILQLVWDVLMTSAGLLRDCRRFRASHVFIPDHVSILRNAPALVLLRLMGVRVIVRLSNAPDEGAFYDFLWHRVLPLFVSRFVANSRFSRDRLLKLGVAERKLDIIHNCVVPAAAARSSDDEILDLLRQRRTLLSVGQIGRYKGTHLVVEAALELLARNHDLQVVIVGPAPDWPPERIRYLEEMRGRIDASPFASRFHFLGERSDVLSIMRESYLLLAPILGLEAFGNVVLEAKSVGLPVVAFGSGGVSELIEHGRTGYLCKSFDLAGLLEGCRYFLEPPDGPGRRVKASHASLDFFRDRDCPYLPERFARSWVEVFRC